MKNVHGAFAAAMPRVAVIQAAFAIPVFECCNTPTATQGSSIIYAPFLKSTRLCHFLFALFGRVSTLLYNLSASVKKSLSLCGNSHENIFIEF